MTKGPSEKEPSQALLDLTSQLRTRLQYEDESGEEAFAFDPLRETRAFMSETPAAPARKIAKPAPTPAPPKVQEPVAPAAPAPTQPKKVEPVKAPATPQARIAQINDVSAGIAGLEKVRETLGDCTRCRLHEGRTNLVFGEGSPQADLMFIGEGPGAKEDALGRPFVGPAGQLLDRMIEAMGLQRESVYIANVVKCRPPRNRDPEIDERHACRPFLLGQIEAIQPKVIVTLGRTATQAVLETDERISRMRGRWTKHPHCDVAVLPTYHPAAILRNRQLRRPVWEDLKLVIDKLELPRNP